MKTQPQEHKFSLLQKIDAYHGATEHEEQMRQELKTFVQSNIQCFERSLLEGHVTGSAWIIDESFQYALLTHHEKLDKWFQLGGHSDGNPDTFEVALREAQEESGLKSIRPLSQEIFDIDIHPIPARGDEPDHLHYDVRFIFIADKNEPIIVSSESKDVVWVNLNEIAKLNQEESLTRMVAKTQNYASSAR